MKTIIISLAIACTLLAATFKTNKTTEVKAEVKNLQGFHFLYYEFTDPYDKAYTDFNLLMKYMTDNKIEMGKYAAGIYMDDPEQVAPDKLRSEIGYMVTKKVNATGKFKYKKVDDLKAVYAHYASQEQIMDTYKAIGNYMIENKLEGAGPSIEIYTSSDGMQADVYMPVK